MSENGTKSEDFHNYCDDKGSTLILIKTNKNKIFGGFTPLNWKKKGKSIISFIFSLNLIKIYDMINKEGKTIYCNSFSLGPNFGNSDFCLTNYMKIGETFANKNCNFLPNNNLELTGEKTDYEKIPPEASTNC